MENSPAANRIFCSMLTVCGLQTRISCARMIDTGIARSPTTLRASSIGVRYLFIPHRLEDKKTRLSTTTPAYASQTLRCFCTYVAYNAIHWSDAAVPDDKRRRLKCILYETCRHCWSMCRTVVNCTQSAVIDTRWQIHPTCPAANLYTPHASKTSVRGGTV